jgi:hypothetical protein
VLDSKTVVPTGKARILPQREQRPAEEAERFGRRIPRSYLTRKYLVVKGNLRK